MQPPPKEIDRARVLQYAIVDHRCSATGACKHQVGGEAIGPVSGLAICVYPSGNEYYLLYCDETWQTITDTGHESMQIAEGQAEFEYEGISRCWVRIESS